MEPLPTGILAAIDAIRTDTQHGASWLAREALQTVGRCASDAKAASPAALLDQIHTCCAALVAARPGMAPVRVWLDRLAAQADILATGTADLDRLRGEIAQRAAELAERSEQAGRQAAGNAVTRLATPSVIFTASFSQTILEACRLAGQHGKLRRLLVAESADPGGQRYGHQLADPLATEGIPAEIVVDADVPLRVAEADRVWLGADAILDDGSILNGVPSLALAQVARQRGLPVEVIAESAKLVPPDWKLGDSIPPGLERLPPDLISAVITEASPRFLGPPVAAPVPSSTPLPPRRGLADPTDVATVAELVARIAARLIERGETLAVVESAAGGRLGDLLTDRPGSSAWFVGGALAASNQRTRTVARVPSETSDRFGAVSPERARALAEGATRVFAATWGLGETGVAGPQAGRRSGKPAGLAYVAVSGPGERCRVEEVSTGVDDRVANKQAFAVAALALLLRELAGEEDGGARPQPA